MLYRSSRRKAHNRQRLTYISETYTLLMRLWIKPTIHVIYIGTMADFRGGLGGAAAGAAAGSAFGPIGIAAGGLLGGIAGLFGGGGGGGDDRDRERQALLADNRAFLRRLTGEFEQADTRDPSESLFFASGVQQLNEAQQQEAQQDAAGAAARGLTGSELEIAQAGNRAQARAAGISDLLTGSEQILASRRAQALARLMQQRGIVNRIATGTLDREAAQESAANRLLGSTIATAVPVLAGLGQ